MINSKLKQTLFGSEDIPVEVDFDGSGNINISTEYIDRIVYKPYSNKYIIPALWKDELNKDALINRLHGMSMLITSILKCHCG